MSRIPRLPTVSDEYLYDHLKVSARMGLVLTPEVQEWFDKYESRLKKQAASTEEPRIEPEPVRPPHPHAELIKLWADGHAIQTRVHGGAWRDTEGLPPLSTGSFVEFRLRPVESEPLWFRVALMRDKDDWGWPLICKNDDEQAIERRPDFDHWITKRIMSKP